MLSLMLNYKLSNKKMKILDSNNKLILVCSNHRSLILIDAKTLKIVSKKNYPLQTQIKAASLQYGTGVSAVCIGSQVHFYDFFYQRQIDILDTYKLIIKVCLRKNILIVIAQDRILLHNLQKKQNQTFIHTFNGKLVFLDEDYFNLSIFYPENSQVLVSKPIWTGNSWKNSDGIKYQKGCYFDKASKIVLSLQNTLCFYEQGQIIKVYGYPEKIIDIKSIQEPKLVFALLQNNQIIGHNLNEQFSYVFEEMKENDFLKISMQNEENLLKKSQNYFWIANQQIYFWIAKNQINKLLKAKISSGIQNLKSDQRSYKQSFGAKLFQKRPKQPQGE